MRNSSLVKWSCAENVTGLKFTTEATGLEEKVRQRWRKEERVFLGEADLRAEVESWKSLSGRGALCKRNEAYRKERLRLAEVRMLV